MRKTTPKKPQTDFQTKLAVEGILSKTHLSGDRFARALGISRKDMGELLRAGVIHHIKTTGGRVFYPPEQLEPARRWLNEYRSGGGREKARGGFLRVLDTRIGQMAEKPGIKQPKKGELITGLPRDPRFVDLGGQYRSTQRAGVLRRFGLPEGATDAELSVTRDELAAQVAGLGKRVDALREEIDCCRTGREFKRRKPRPEDEIIAELNPLVMDVLNPLKLELERLKLVLGD
jgi:biotin operon repressor